MVKVWGRMLGALKRLRPQQLQNTGAGSVQVGKAGGGVRVVNVNRHQHVQVHQHFYAALPCDGIWLQRPARSQRPTLRRSAPRRAAVRQLTQVHREVLTMMEPLPKGARGAVLDFMSRDFGTRMVKELTPAEAHRVRAYVMRVRANRMEAGHELS